MICYTARLDAMRFSARHHRSQRGLVHFQCDVQVEVVRSDFASYPNVKAWVDRMKGLKTWKQVYETIDGYAASLKDAPMQTV